MRYKAITLAVLVACCATGSSALTLGRARGAAWIGQSLDISALVQADPGQSVSSLCLEADVFHADSRVEASKVQLTAEPGAQPDTFNVRIASSAVVDEPVVTVYLRAGCAQKATRKYVFLADYANEAPAPVATPRAVVEVAAPTSPAAEANASSASPLANGSQTLNAAPVVVEKSPPKPTASPKAASPRPAPAAKPATPPASKAKSAPANPPKAKEVPPKKSAETGKPRLKLDPLENLAERIKTLETNTASVPLDEMTKEAQRLQQMQSDVKALLEQAAKNEVSLMAMRERLEKAESERVPMAVVYGLGALLLLTMGALVVLWTRRNDVRDWRNSPHTEQPPASNPPTVAPPMVEEAQPSIFNEVKAAELVVKEAHHAGVDLNLSELATLEPEPAIDPSRHPNFHSEEIYDIRQRAEFFTQLGKVDEAIESLEAGIRSSGQHGAQLYLDLLSIASQHNLTADFRLFKEEFQQRFKARVPELGNFYNEGKGLEDYPELLRQLTHEWAHNKVLTTIEGLILKGDASQEDGLPALDMAAFSDLIALHGIVLQRTR